MQEDFLTLGSSERLEAIGKALAENKEKFTSLLAKLSLSAIDLASKSSFFDDETYEKFQPLVRTQKILEALREAVEDENLSLRFSCDTDIEKLANMLERTTADTVNVSDIARYAEVAEVAKLSNDPSVAVLGRFTEQLFGNCIVERLAICKVHSELARVRLEQLENKAYKAHIEIREAKVESLLALLKTPSPNL